MEERFQVFVFAFLDGEIVVLMGFRHRCYVNHNDKIIRGNLLHDLSGSQVADPVAFGVLLGFLLAVGDLDVDCVEGELAGEIGLHDCVDAELVVHMAFPSGLLFDAVDFMEVVVSVSYEEYCGFSR